MQDLFMSDNGSIKSSDAWQRGANQVNQVQGSSSPEGTTKENGLQIAHIFQQLVLVSSIN